MALERSHRPLAQYLRCTRHNRISLLHFRSLTTSPPTESIEPPPPPPSDQSKKGTNPQPHLVHTPRSERRLLALKNQSPLGSRRLRAALASSTNIPFSQLPYQCFQEARKVLQEDRAEKVEEITKQREKIGKLEAKEAVEGFEHEKATKLRSARFRLEKLKIWADSNDPLVKKRFEDGMGDMSKPIYRHLAHKHWSSYKRLLLMQRIEQMHVVPDVLPSIDPSVSTTLYFHNPTSGRQQKHQHGDFVPSLLSETPPAIKIQPYNKGTRLVTIAVINPDVPNVETDSFDSRCHFLACNIPISPTSSLSAESGEDILIDLASLDPETQTLIPWLPPYAQKGTPYQRLCLFVLEQHPPSIPPPAAVTPPAPNTKPKSTAGTKTTDPNTGPPRYARLDLAHLRFRVRFTKREDFSLRSFVSKFEQRPVGVDLFRTQWDEGTREVMERAGVVGADVEFRRKRVEPLPYRRLKGERFR